MEAAKGIDEDRSQERTIVVDLLDDWTVHPAFSGIKADVERAYRCVFDRADHVVANSEGTVALAQLYGRTDVELVANGVDPERFDQTPRRHTDLVVGYGGKIGFRLDTDLIDAVCAALPFVTFEFVGPILDRPVGTRLKALPNVRLLGDVRYDRYPDVFRGWDVAWAPHNIGENEVGGDLIKLYEYRAAGLPTFSTKVIGWQRALPGVRSHSAADLVGAMVSFVADRAGSSVPREPIAMPDALTWNHKATRLLELVGV